MVVIAKHCQSQQDYFPQQKWPGDAYVQWGQEGIVLTPKGPYMTAFFEAFLEKPDTFIRGEGETLEIAESRAFAQLQKYLNCNMHEFINSRTCRNCGLWRMI